MIDDGIVVTFFASEAATTMRREVLTLEELAGRIAVTSAPTKAQLPWLKLATFANARSPQGSLRHNANMISVSEWPRKVCPARPSSDLRSWKL